MGVLVVFCKLCCDKKDGNIHENLLSNHREACVQTFKIEATSWDEALSIAEEGYRKGEFVVDNSYFHHKQMEITGELEPTEWVEF